MVYWLIHILQTIFQKREDHTNKADTESTENAEGTKNTEDAEDAESTENTEDNKLIVIPVYFYILFYKKPSLWNRFKNWCKRRRPLRVLSNEFGAILRGCIGYVAFYAVLHTCVALNPALIEDMPLIGDVLGMMDAIVHFAARILDCIFSFFRMLIDELHATAETDSLRNTIEFLFGR